MGGRLDALPSGIVTFCFTDIEASTPLLARLGSDAYQEQLEIHRGLIRDFGFAGGNQGPRSERMMMPSSGGAASPQSPR